MQDDSRDALGLLAWQWSVYPGGHRNGVNLTLHLFTAPLFLLGTVALAASPLVGWQLAPIGLSGLLLAFAAQMLGHRAEASPPKPFRGPFDVLARFFVEQWITFPRYVVSGGFGQAWRSRRMTTQGHESGPKLT
jgi:hypothetical protein